MNRSGETESWDWTDCEVLLPGFVAGFHGGLVSGPHAVHAIDAQRCESRDGDPELGSETRVSPGSSNRTKRKGIHLWRMSAIPSRACVAISLVQRLETAEVKSVRRLFHLSHLLPFCQITSRDYSREP